MPGREKFATRHLFDRTTAGNPFGAQIRRTAITGRDSLTAAELRTVSPAASGQSNKQIAQTAFVTLKTVENHLAAELEG